MPAPRPIARIACGGPARTLRRTTISFRLQSTTSHPAPAPAVSPSRLRPTRRFLLYASLGLLLGASAGTLLTHTIAPPAHPEPSSHDDRILLHDLETRIDNEFKVKVLRGKCTAAAANLRGDSGIWRELTPSQSASHLDDTTENALVARAMAGSRSLGVERVFWNSREKELVAIVWFGGALSGWPGVAHGGSIATVLGDKSSLAAGLLKAEASGGDDQDVRSSQSPEPVEMELTYKKPTYANAFYVVRVVPRYAVSEGSGTAVTSLGKQVEVEGKLETLDGVTCVGMKSVIHVTDSVTVGLRTAKEAAKGALWTGWLR